MACFYIWCKSSHCISGTEIWGSLLLVKKWMNFYRISACLCMQSVMLLWQICLFVPSHAGIVSKQMHTSSNSFHHLVRVWLVF